MAYKINNTFGTQIVSLADGTLDTTTTDLTLFGKGYAGFGEKLNENLVKLLENFNNTSAPSNKITGQLWYDQTNKQINVYTGAKWKPVGSTTNSTTSPINAVQGDLWFDRGDNCNRNVKFEPNKGANEQSVLKVQQGQFVIFPSNVFHGTQKNRSNEDRISYSFDIDPIGFDYKLPPTKIVQDVWNDFNTTITKIGLTEALLDES